MPRGKGTYGRKRGRPKKKGKKKGGKKKLMLGGRGSYNKLRK